MCSSDPAGRDELLRDRADGGGGRLIRDEALAELGGDELRGGRVQADEAEHGVEFGAAELFDFLATVESAIRASLSPDAPRVPSEHACLFCKAAGARTCNAV